MENNRVYNFNPGPAMLPLEVLKEAQSEMLNFKNSGMSILEISHRAKEYDEVHNQAKADIKELMGLGDDYEVLFIQGGDIHDRRCAGAGGGAGQLFGAQAVHGLLTNRIIRV